MRCAPWVELLQCLDGVIDIALIEVKYFSQYQEREAFKALPKSMTLAGGIVDEACYWIEPVKKIRERIGDWPASSGRSACGFRRAAASTATIAQHSGVAPEGREHG